jgi:alanyl-tRNA synthetase
MMTGVEIRDSYLEFFKEKGHTIKPSVSLVPSDPTVLFTIAGMVPFKPLFLGKISPLPFTRAASSQRCLRTNDIENVGKTARHHTFFEMLGNFSFGDYFKQEAILWAWEFLTSVVKLPPEKLWVSVYLDDEEAQNIWCKEIGLPEERIVRLGEEDNFWTMGDTGPCGPCSEILIDQGEEIGCKKDSCSVECDCDRFLELWNLVFTQFDRDANGKLHPLPKKNIDTGMGLERLTAVLQGKKSNFECDLLFVIIRACAELAEIVYGKDEQHDISLRIIADHMRAITFLIYDNVLPSNEGRGYVLRSLIRRAIRQGRRLGINNAFLYQLVPSVIKATNIQEVSSYRDHISRIIKQEEERFAATLDKGMYMLEELIKEYKERNETIISGKDIFRLYDTYGFPVTFAEEIIKDVGLNIDKQEFDKEMDIQRDRARKAGIGIQYLDKAQEVMVKHHTKFVGYDTMKTEVTILDIIKDKNLIKDASQGEEVQIILDITPFYAEAGGQIGDKGILSGKEVRVDITDTLYAGNGEVIIHQARIRKGILRQGDKLTANVDVNKRINIARNHTATHLLHAALRQVLGVHVKQAGSLVCDKYLRFDFTHLSPLTDEELQRIEELINAKIRENIIINVFETELSEAENMGAIALFGEKYSEKVRVVKIGDYSIELCGGTHVSATGEIGLFKINAEMGVSSGIRRIEAISGEGAYQYVQRQHEIITEIAEIVKAPVEELVTKIEKLVKVSKEREKEIYRLKEELNKYKIDELLNSVIKIGDINVIITSFNHTEQELLRQTADLVIEKIRSGVVILSSVINNKVLWVAKVSKDLTSKVHAGVLIKQIAQITGGGGGGRADLAQAGGTKPEKIKEAIEVGKKFLLQLQQG